MSVLKRNLSANFAGTIWQSIIGLIFTPIYISFIGIESWGLIGIFATLQAVFGILDIGLSNTINRELARLSVLVDREQEMKDILRTLETIYWFIAITVGIIVFLLSETVANYWIIANNLTPEQIKHSFIVMGVVISLRMPIGFYTGGLIGLQEQVLLNLIIIAISTVNGLGATFALHFVSPTIQTFFSWQIILCIINLFILRYFVYRKMPSSENKGKFNILSLKRVWKFTVGISGISVFAVLLTQLDKIILSKLLTLEHFAYYALASLISISLARLFTPIFHSIYPRITQLVSSKNDFELTEIYHKSCQFMAVVIFPIAILISLFSKEVIMIWTQDIVTAEKTYLIVSILIVGTAINGIMYIPYALQLAYGWTSLSFYKNIVAVLFLVPLITIATNKFGAIGAATAWLGLNIGYVIFEIPFMHKRIMKGEKKRWYLKDLFFPLFSGLVVGIIFRVLFNFRVDTLLMIIFLIFTYLSILGITIVTTDTTRNYLLKEIKAFK